MESFVDPADQSAVPPMPKGLYTFHPIVPSEARGARVLAEDGREFLDLTSGLGVLHLGHGHPGVVRAMQDQLQDLTHMCAHVMVHRPYLDLSARLNKMAPCAPPSKTFLCNSGAEAVENAVKVARCATGRKAVVAFDGGYHGRTLLSATLTSRAKPYRQGFGTLAPDVHHVPYPYCYRCPWGGSPENCSKNCLRALERFFLLECAPEDVAAVIVEPIQGEGGVVVPPDEFLPALGEICSRHGILIIADEVQTGLGRTGAAFAVEHWGFAPPVVVLGKALGAGLPLAAVVGQAPLMDAVPGSGLGTTFGGNPVACRGAQVLLDVLQQEALPARALEIEGRFRQRAQAWCGKIPAIGEVRGRGAMLGIELVKNRESREPAPAAARKVVRAALDRGVILLSGGIHRNVVRLLPPLNVPWDDLEHAMEQLEGCLREVF